MDKKDYIYIGIILAVLVLCFARNNCEDHKNHLQQDSHQEQLTEVLPKMGQ